MYNLEQIKAPDGYELNKTPIQFIVNEDSKVVKVPWERNPIKTTVNLAIHKINEKGLPMGGSITISKKVATFTAYKLLDATKSGDAYEYSVNSDLKDFFNNSNYGSYS